MNALTLPDIAAQIPAHAQALDWVGMQAIALPINLAGQRINARADAGVSLDDGNARGIHMSRLYLALHALEYNALSPATLQQLLGEFLDSHQGLSQQASITLRGEALLSRPALVSPLAGWPRGDVRTLAVWGFPTCHPFEKWICNPTSSPSEDS